MSRDFSVFSRAVEKRFSAWANVELFVVDADKDAVWDKYLASFPEGTNPVFRVRTEHDCSCCKNFVRNIGNVVAIVDGEVQTIWDVKNVGHPYQEVAEAMNAFVASLPIKSVFRTKEHRYGLTCTHELVDGRTRRWDHFVGNVSSRHQSRDADSVRGQMNTAAEVLKRGLEEITAQSIETIIDLIASNAIYRGQEFKSAVTAFQKLRTAYHRLNSDAARMALVWENVNSPAARFRNTVIGTLAQDLSEGIDLEKAVRSFETKVAPESYKRPTALVTPTMVKAAMKTITELGLEPALHRRFAKISDVSVNNVLFVDNAVKPQMKDGIEGLLMEAVVPTQPKLNKPEPISVDDFMRDVLPRASSIELLVENKMLANFVSLTAPVHPEPKSLFKWNNDFAWSYDGNVTDSIREKVKRAGGNVDAKMRVSLAWFNLDDLDIHVWDPRGTHIYYGNKNGNLDVDMNVVTPVRDPVENVSWTRLVSGTYKVSVNNYRKRESAEPGFVLEVEADGHVQTFRYERAVPHDSKVDALTIEVDEGRIRSIKTGAGVVGGAMSQKKWGIDTETFVTVDTLLLSPNYWDDNATGNKHWFFILKGAKNPEPVRGIYNEFLNPALDQHRKVFELLGDKTKCPVTDEQLSGVGFSSTRQDKATVLVRGNKIQKAYTITF